MNQNEKTPVKKPKVLSIHKRIYSLNQNEMNLRPVTSQTLTKNTIITKTISNFKTTNLFSTTEPYETFDTPDINDKHNQRKYKKNINEFRHIITSVPSMGNSGIKWMINLRNQQHKEESNIQTEIENMNLLRKKQNENFNNTEKSNKTITTNFNPPSFYENDLSKYKTRNNFFKNKRTHSTSINPNFVEVSHLTSNHLGETVNTTQYNFETTLRLFNLKSNPPSLKPKPKWNRIPSLLKTINHNECLPPCNKKSIENIKKMDPYIVRPFHVVYDKTSVGKYQIRTKKLVRDNVRKTPYLGEHISSGPYSSKYQDVDTFRNHEILKKHNNTLCLFELCLRNYGSLERKVVKRRGKDEMIKLKKNNIEKNRKEFIKMKERNNNNNNDNKNNKLEM